MKKLFILIQGLFTYFFLAVPAFAETLVDPCTNPGATGIAAIMCNLGGENIPRTIRNIVVFVVVLAVIIALLYLLYGGVKWVMSRGEKEQVESARNHIVAAIVGLILVFLAIFILSIILSVFGIGFGTLKLPTISGTTPTN